MSGWASGCVRAFVRLSDNTSVASRRFREQADDATSTAKTSAAKSNRFREDDDDDVAVNNPQTNRHQSSAKSKPKSAPGRFREDEEEDAEVDAGVTVTGTVELGTMLLSRLSEEGRNRIKRRKGA